VKQGHPILAFSTNISSGVYRLLSVECESSGVVILQMREGYVERVLDRTIKTSVVKLIGFVSLRA